MERPRRDPSANAEAPLGAPEHGEHTSSGGGSFAGGLELRDQVEAFDLIEPSDPPEESGGDIERDVPDDSERGPGICVSRASPRCTKTLGHDRAERSSVEDNAGSISIARTSPANLASSRVSRPVPAPTSTTRSADPTSNARTSSAADRGPRKCRPLVGTSRRGREERAPTELTTQPIRSNSCDRIYGPCFRSSSMAGAGLPVTATILQG